MSDEPLENSVTHLIRLMKEGEDAALTELWQRYVHRLIAVARRQLSTYSSTLIDEEDILISVFDRLFKATQKNQFAKLENRDDLWQILVMLTERKVIDHQRRERAQKRGGDRIQPFSDLKLSIREFEELAENGPDPERAALFNESLAQALNRLDDERTRQVAVMRLEGYSVAEIATELQIGARSVDRKLRLIRELWGVLE